MCTYIGNQDEPDKLASCLKIGITRYWIIWRILNYFKLSTSQCFLCNITDVIRNIIAAQKHLDSMKLFSYLLYIIKGDQSQSF